MFPPADPSLDTHDPSLAHSPLPITGNYYKPCKDQRVFEQLNKQSLWTADTHNSMIIRQAK